MKFNFILMLLITVNSYAGDHPLKGNWEGVTFDEFIITYSSLKIDSNLSGAFQTKSNSTFSGGIGTDTAFTRKDVTDMGGYYVIRFPNNPDGKLVVTMPTLGTMKLWVIMSNEKSSATIPFDLTKIKDGELSKLIN